MQRSPRPVCVPQRPAFPMLPAYRLERPSAVDAKSCWKHLLANSLVAFLLNHSVTYLLRISSGLTMVLSRIYKDICIVSLAAVIFGAHLEHIQIAGFIIAIVGIFAHSMVKSFPEVADEHGVIKGIYVVAFKELGPKRAD